MTWHNILHIVSVFFDEIIFGFTFYYPFFMAWLWMIGGVWFFLRYERGTFNQINNPPPLKNPQPCSILIPCYNEENNVLETFAYALRTRYPEYEVIAINDGSSDRTGAMLDELARKHQQLRVIHLVENQGKAVALNIGAAAARYNYFVCIDGDAMIHPYAVYWLMSHLVEGGRVGAVTGNPRIHNRSTLIGKIQVGEFSSIIGLIKRAQRTYGRIFTVSGVISAFNKAALHRVGYWNANTVTEDIDVSWRLELDFFDIRFEPKALCYIYMPETIRGLWMQRLRWSQGGIEALLRYSTKLFSWRRRRFWGVALESVLGIVWSYTVMIVIALYFLGLVVPLPPNWQVGSILPRWHGMILATTCLIQFLVSMLLEYQYERPRYFRYYFWVIWYPMLYWILSMSVVIVALPKALFKRRRRGRWRRYDHGIRPVSKGE